MLTDGLVMRQTLYVTWIAACLLSGCTSLGHKAGEYQRQSIYQTVYFQIDAATNQHWHYFEGKLDQKNQPTFGVLYFDDGATFKGSFKQGEPYKGHLSFEYQGLHIDFFGLLENGGLKEGALESRLFKYEGSFVAQLPHDQFRLKHGKVVWPNGSQYEGSFFTRGNQSAFSKGRFHFHSKSISLNFHGQAYQVRRSTQQDGQLFISMNGKQYYYQQFDIKLPYTPFTHLPLPEFEQSVLSYLKGER